MLDVASRSNLVAFFIDKVQFDGDRCILCVYARFDSIRRYFGCRLENSRNFNQVFELGQLVGKHDERFLANSMPCLPSSSRQFAFDAVRDHVDQTDAAQAHVQVAFSAYPAALRPGSAAIDTEQQPIVRPSCQYTFATTRKDID